MIRPDTLAEGLKVTQSAALFSPLALLDIDGSSTQARTEPHCGNGQRPELG